MKSDIMRKRAKLKALFRDAMGKAHEEGRGALANIYYGRIIRVDAGRYDDKLDEHIAEMSDAA